ncbi:MAG: hypothetical protein AAGF10_03290 [Verrucomicrobiota bacterium]
MDKGFQRNSILLALHAIAPGSFAEQAILHAVQAAGYPRMDEPSLKRDLEYLKDKGLVVSAPAVLNKGQTRWRITAAGTDHLEEHGFA